jgi:hypothetical protein
LLCRLEIAGFQENGWQEPYESRGSHTKLWGTGSEIPPVYSTTEFSSNTKFQIAKHLRVHSSCHDLHSPISRCWCNIETLTCPLRSAGGYQPHGKRRSPYESPLRRSLLSGISSGEFKKKAPLKTMKSYLPFSTGNSVTESLNPSHPMRLWDF